MTTKQNSKTARANLFVTREQMKNAHGSAQSRAFRARQLAKDARDAAARKVNAAKAAETAAAAGGERKTEEPVQDESRTTSGE